MKHPPSPRKTPVDSTAKGMLHPLDISAGASGLTFIGASSFGDAGYLSGLAATLNFSAFPALSEGRLHYCAGNQLGDAVLLYASVLGPLWTQAKDRLRHE